MIRVLYVDDSAEDFRIVRFQISRITKEIEIDGVENVAAALAAMDDKSYDCILCDYLMDDTDGVQFLHDLRSRGAATPFILLTGHGNETVAAQALRGGADDYFTKEESLARCDRLVRSIKNLIKARKHDETRKRAIEDLRLSEERLRQVVSNMPIMMDAFDERGVIVVWNKECERVTGYSAAEIVGNPDAMHLLYPDKAYLQRMMGEWQKRGQYYRNWEWNVTCKDGTVKTIAWFQISGRYPIPGWAQWGCGIDVTERKNAQDALAESRDKLAEQTRLLEATNKELESFAYTVSHDLQAPLRRIGSWIELLQLENAERLTDKCREYIAYINNNRSEMQNLITDLLHFSRLMLAGLRREPVDLSAIARAIAGDLQTDQPHRKVEFSIAADIQADCDPSLVKVVLQNLLGNAWKYTLRRQKARIKFAVRTKQKKRVYYVKDNGIGFDPAYSDHLFLPFKRLHKDKEFAGSGIGLATAQRIIHRHGGRIWAEGAPGKGAAFYFTLQ
jgi:PAS domain S-box-containing protein